MTSHLSTVQVKQLCLSGLPKDELVAAALHTAECQACYHRFVEELKRQRNPVSFSFTLEPEFAFRNEHVDFDQLVALADKILDESTEEIINIHLQTCEPCAEDVRSFLAFRKDTAHEMDISYGRPKHQATHDVVAAPWFHLRRAYALAAIVLIVVAVLIGLSALNKKTDSFEASNQDQKNPGIIQSPNPSSSPAPIVVSTPTVDESAKVATLNDRSGPVTIDKKGRVTGLGDVSENARHYIAQAALSEQLGPADVLRRLPGEQSALRGTNSGGDGFRLLYPTRKVVIENRPVFRWESLPGVSSYRVYVLDETGNQVGQSEDLPSDQTQWKAPLLRRGQIYSWVVTAVLNGKEIVSPSASAPEIKFAVLSGADLQELSRLKKTKSHLALGVFYARAGLLDEAEREFAGLSKLNSQSELPRKLLQSVRNMRKEN